jgi:hypothetical protein
VHNVRALIHQDSNGFSIWNSSILPSSISKEEPTSTVQLRFYWPRMKEDITRHIQTCESCQSNKAKQHKTHGLLSPLPVPSGPWESIPFDTLYGLPEIGRFNNAIFVVVDRLTKMSHFKAFPFGEQELREIPLGNGGQTTWSTLEHGLRQGH